MSSFELNLQAATAAVAAAEAAVASAKASLESLSRSANGLLAPEKQIMKRIPFISLLNNDGGGAKKGMIGVGVGGKRWREEWASRFDRNVLTEEDVRAGDKGSIGIGYWLKNPLDILLNGKTEDEKLTTLIAEKATVGDGSPQPLIEEKTRGQLVGKLSLESALEFYNFAQGKEVFFAIKRGTTGLWLAKKTSGYFCDEEGKFGYKHRFRFEIIRRLTAEEQPNHHVQLIVYKTISVPA
jgi:hypothetical protein